MKSPSQVAMFLNIAKRAVEEHGLALVERAASMQFLTDRNMTVGELESVVLALRVSDCFDGPEADRDARFADWTVAEFSPAHCGERLYLKLSVKVAAGRCKCLSVKLYSEREVGL